jgi:hypothetical protein
MKFAIAIHQRCIALHDVRVEPTGLQEQHLLQLLGHQGHDVVRPAAGGKHLGDHI